MSDWKDKCSYLSPEGVVSKVGGEDKKFFPISVEMAFKLRNMGSGMAGAFGALFVDTTNDSGSKSKTTVDKDITQTETYAEPIDPRLAEVRSSQKERSFKNIFDSIVNDNNKETLALVVLDSMKEDFPRDSRPPVKDFLSEVPLPVFTEMLIGVFKANKGVLGPLGETIGDLFNKVVESAKVKALPAVAASKVSG